MISPHLAMKKKSALTRLLPVRCTVRKQKVKEAHREGVENVLRYFFLLPKTVLWVHPHKNVPINTSLHYTWSFTETDGAEEMRKLRESVLVENRDTF